MALHVVVAKYKDVIGARDAIAAVKDAGIKLADQAYVLNNGNGDLEFKEGKDAGGGKGFVYGAVLTAAAGALLGPVGWTVAAGGIAGGLVAKLHDANIPSEKLERVGAALKVGEGAAIAVTKEGDQDQVAGILEAAGGTVEALGVTDELKTALDGMAPVGVTVSEDGQVSDS